MIRGGCLCEPPVIGGGGICDPVVAFLGFSDVFQFAEEFLSASYLQNSPDDDPPTALLDSCTSEFSLPPIETPYSGLSNLSPGGQPLFSFSGVLILTD